MIVQVSSSGCLVRIAQLHDMVAREQHWSRSRASSRQPRRSRLVKLKMPWPMTTPCMYYCPKATNKKTGGPAAILRDIGRLRSTWEIKLPPAATWTIRRGCVFARSACSGFFLGFYFFFCCCFWSTQTSRVAPRSVFETRPFCAPHCSIQSCCPSLHLLVLRFAPSSGTIDETLFAPHRWGKRDRSVVRSTVHDSSDVA